MAIQAPPHPRRSPRETPRSVVSVISVLIVTTVTTVTMAMSALTNAQRLDPELLTKPPVDAWPTYHGGYSGRPYRPADQITASNGKHLAPAGVYGSTTSA